MALSWSWSGEKTTETNEAPAQGAGRLEAFEAAFNSAGIGFWIFGCRAGALQTSGGVNEIYGQELPRRIAPQELPELLFGPDWEDKVGADWRAAWTGESLFDQEHLVHHGEGVEFWARSIVSVVMGKDGEPDRAFGLVIDINQQKKREQDYRAASERAETASQHKSEFVATLSHEIRTPLNGVMGMAQILMATELDDNQRACVDTIVSSSNALMHILNDSLDLSKIEAGLVELANEPFDLEELVRAVVANASGVAAQKGVDTGYDYSSACRGQAVGDSERLRQILSNLLFNGLKFTERGSVTIEVEPAEDGMTRLSVRDTGPGIPAAELARIFERFRQTRAEECGQRRGTGLGLPISKNLAELMGGRIGVESVLGAGSVFWVELPLLPPSEAEAPEVADNQDAGADASGGDAAPDDDGGVRILVAEDDPTNQKVFRMAFEPTGYAIEFANNGQEALDWLARSHFDLVLMDINMPVMSGEEAIRRIRAEEEAPWRDVPIIVVTALTNRDSRRYYCSIGATDYLPKPLDIAQLMKKTQNLLDGAAAQA